MQDPVQVDAEGELHPLPLHRRARSYEKNCLGTFSIADTGF
jgi:hypothetical protein